MHVFKSAKESLGDLTAQAAAKLIAAATDVAIIVDDSGVIRDVAFNKDDLALELDGHGRWLGSKFLEVVTSESRPKIEALLVDGAKRRASSWRQVNHAASGGEDIPVQYSAIDIGRKDRVLVIGRELRPLAQMQKRLIGAQQSMERDYNKLRQAETRYRLLFQVASEAVLIVDAATQTITEANPAALALMGESAAQVIRSNLARHFAPPDAPAVTAMLADVRTRGRDDDLPALLADGQAVTVAASLFRQEASTYLLLRLRTESGASENAVATSAAARLRQHFDRAADGMVLTQSDGSITRANRAFLELAQLADEAQCHGEPLDTWLGRAGVEFNVALTSLRQSGSLRLLATHLRGAYGATTEIEVSAVALDPENADAGYGFVIRNIEKRLTTSPRMPSELPRSVAQLTEMIGRVPLRDLVRETTDVIEKLSIEAALELTGDNRASAAEMLGLSRQSLYVKLRRFGLADPVAEEEEDNG